VPIPADPQRDLEDESTIAVQVASSTGKCPLKRLCLSTNLLSDVKGALQSTYHQS
jgi:hypothetical protein